MNRRGFFRVLCGNGLAAAVGLLSAPVVAATAVAEPVVMLMPIGITINEMRALRGRPPVAWGDRPVEELAK